MPAATAILNVKGALLYYCAKYVSSSAYLSCPTTKTADTYRGVTYTVLSRLILQLALYTLIDDEGVMYL